jgi:hypothetical protein
MGAPLPRINHVIDVVDIDIRHCRGTKFIYEVTFDGRNVGKALIRKFDQRLWMEGVGEIEVVKGLINLHHDCQHRFSWNQSTIEKCKSRL